MAVIDEIAAERHRQIEVEGWSPEHDQAHSLGEMAFAAAAYAVHAANEHEQLDIAVGRRQKWCIAGWVGIAAILWPWSEEWWKPKNPRRDLIRAAALIVAEIERLDRAAKRAA